MEWESNFVINGKHEIIQKSVNNDAEYMQSRPEFSGVSSIATFTATDCNMNVQPGMLARHPQKCLYANADWKIRKNGELKTVSSPGNSSEVPRKISKIVETTLESRANPGDSDGISTECFLVSSSNTPANWIGVGKVTENPVTTTSSNVCTSRILDFDKNAGSGRLISPSPKFDTNVSNQNPKLASILYGINTHKTMDALGYSDKSLVLQNGGNLVNVAKTAYLDNNFNLTFAAADDASTAESCFNNSNVGSHSNQSTYDTDSKHCTSDASGDLSKAINNESCSSLGLKTTELVIVNVKDGSRLGNDVSSEDTKAISNMDSNSHPDTSYLCNLSKSIVTTADPIPHRYPKVFKVLKADLQEMFAVSFPQVPNAVTRPKLETCELNTGKLAAVSGSSHEQTRNELNIIDSKACDHECNAVDGVAQLSADPVLAATLFKICPPVQRITSLPVEMAQKVNSNSNNNVFSSVISASPVPSSGATVTSKNFFKVIDANATSKPISRSISINPDTPKVASNLKCAVPSTNTPPKAELTLSCQYRRLVNLPRVNNSPKICSSLAQPRVNFNESTNKISSTLNNSSNLNNTALLHQPYSSNTTVSTVNFANNSVTSIKEATRINCKSSVVKKEDSHLGSPVNIGRFSRDAASQNVLFSLANTSEMKLCSAREWQRQTSRTDNKIPFLPDVTTTVYSCTITTAALTISLPASSFTTAALTRLPAANPFTTAYLARSPATSSFTTASLTRSPATSPFTTASLTRSPPACSFTTASLARSPASSSFITTTKEDMPQPTITLGSHYYPTRVSLPSPLKDNSIMSILPVPSDTPEVQQMPSSTSSSESPSSSPSVVSLTATNVTPEGSTVSSTTSVTTTATSPTEPGGRGYSGHRLRIRNQRKFLPEKTRHKRQTLQDMTRPLKQWLYKHKENPYPTKVEKLELVNTSQMTMTQVSNWFANARRRLKNTVRGDDVSWAKRIKEYNHFAEGNAELFSIPSSDDEDWDLDEDEMANENDETTLPSKSATCQSTTPSPAPTLTSSYSDSSLTSPAPALSLMTSPDGTTRSSPALDDHHGSCHKYKQSILQRYLHDASQENLIPDEDLVTSRARHRHLSSSTGSHDFEYLSTSSVSSPSHEAHHDSFDDFSEEFESIAIRRRIGDKSNMHNTDEMYWKEIGAALALTSLARSHNNS